MAFNRIVAGQDPEIIAQIVQLQLLDAFGVAPQLGACVICGKEKGIFDYSIAAGGWSAATISALSAACTCRQRLLP